MSLDPITFAVVKNGLDAIVDEMAYTVIRTARPEIVKDVMDYSAAFCDAEGRMLAQAKTIAQHLGAIPDAMASVLHQTGDDLHPGDVMIMNDPYEGGMHLPDVFMFMPIFLDGCLEGFAVVIAHQTDMGGRVAGSNASDSTEIYQEGLRIPVVKLYERGAPSRSVFRIIEKNVRVPDRVVGDIQAQYAACRVGEREFVKLLRRYGAGSARAYMAELIVYAERVTRDEIRTWPKGTFTFTDHLDSDGLSDAPIPLRVAITVHDDRLTCDWTGSSPQVKAALNSTFSFTKSCTYLSVRSVLRRDVPNNVGVFRGIDVIAAEGSVLNPRPPAACAARALTGYRVMDTMFGALAQVLPERVPAAGEGGNTVVSLGGYREDGRPFVVVDMICGAWGGRPDKDGIEAITNPSQNMSNTPVEILKSQHPIRIEEYALVPDSGGAGRHRGGLGLRRAYRLLAAEANLQLRSDRMRFQPYGLAGGQPARPTRNELTTGGQTRTMPAKFACTLREGDVFLHEAGGGRGIWRPVRARPCASSGRRPRREDLAGICEAGVRGRRGSADTRAGRGRHATDPGGTRGVASVELFRVPARLSPCRRSASGVPQRGGSGRNSPTGPAPNEPRSSKIRADDSWSLPGSHEPSLHHCRDRADPMRHMVATRCYSQASSLLDTDPAR